MTIHDLSNLPPEHWPEDAKLRFWRLGWLRTLISEYRKHYVAADDEDPSATDEMLTECEQLLRTMVAELPDVGPVAAAAEQFDDIPW